MAELPCVKPHRAFALLYDYGVLFDVLGYARRGHGQRATDASGGIYLGAITGLSFATLLSLLFAKITDAFSFTLLLGTLSSVFIAIRVSTELLPFLAPADQAIVGHLPVARGTRFAARLAVLGTLIAIQLANWNLPPAIVVGFAFGGPRASVVYLLVALCLALAATGSVLLLNLLAIRAFGWHRVRESLVYLQVASTAIVLVAVLGLPKLAGEQQGAVVDVLNQLGLAWPPAWYAHLFCAAAGFAFDARGASLAVLVTALAVLPFLFVARTFEPMASAAASDVAAGGRLIDRGTRWVALRVAHPVERPFFMFAALNFRRDFGFRVRAYPLLVYPIAILAFAGKHTPDHYYVIMVQVVALYMMLIATFVPYTDHPKAAWLLKTLPIGSQSRALLGVEKAFVWTFLMPSYALIAAALCCVWQPWLAITQTALAGLVATVFVALAFRQQRRLPFAEEFRGQLGSESSVSALMGFTLVLGIIGFLQYALGFKLIGYLGFGLTALTAVKLLHRNRSGHRNEPDQLPEESPSP